jgi:leader peptidase (prepilin peptidase)/N-methyltransferase
MTEYILFPGWFAFIVGACIGSFLNVCIYRIPENRSIISPGSFCPHCHNSIPFYLNVPILSYLFLKGRCKFCNHSISIRYPLIEALTGIFAVLLVLKFGVTPVAFFWFIFISALITISLIDMDHQIIPDRISIPGIFIFASSFYFLPEMTLLRSFTGILAGGGLLYAVAAFYYLLRRQEGMGGGDIKLLAMIGAATGVKGVLFTVFTGSLLGTLAGMATMFYMKRSDTKFRIPFGPFLSAGSALYVFFGNELIQWYMGIIGR